MFLRQENQPCQGGFNEIVAPNSDREVEPRNSFDQVLVNDVSDNLRDVPEDMAPNNGLLEDEKQDGYVSDDSARCAIKYDS